MTHSRTDAIARLRTNLNRPNSKLLDENYREPRKSDFIGAKYQIKEIHWSEYVDDRGRPIYGKRPLWIVERYSRRQGWVGVTSQILPYFYEEMAFLSYESALRHQRDLEDPNSPYFDGFRNYQGQDINRFEPEYFPKD